MSQSVHNLTRAFDQDWAVCHVAREPGEGGRGGGGRPVLGQNSVGDTVLGVEREQGGRAGAWRGEEREQGGTSGSGGEGSTGARGRLLVGTIGLTGDRDSGLNPIRCLAHESAESSQ